MLQDSFLSLDSEKVPLYVVINSDILQMAEILAEHVAYLFQFLVECLPDERGHVEVERRDCLSSVHLVLHGFHRDAAQYAGGLDSFCRP